MKIFVGTDHAGFGLKDKLVEFLQGHGHQVVDKGAFQYDEADDYPDFTIPVAKEVNSDNSSRGIILGATGEAEAMCANKFPHVRAVVFYGNTQSIVDDEADILVRSREHNDSNILVLGARYLTEDMLMNAVSVWIRTAYDGGERHVRRLAKIDAIKF
ncbi:RpiB/LacA/LacB family sugar-phosphate isomerase [Patescibacteria group bacterium]|nr:RpiB/LacA/LacB family sugar-phosphate isomerase [Patescibacteria group bacterium]